jgi:hypothetical protein
MYYCGENQSDRRSKIFVLGAIEPVITTPRRCYYNPKTHTIIDLMRSNGLSYARQHTLKRMQQRFPEVEVWDYFEAISDMQSAKILEQK